MERGTVKWYNEEKGYGFIKSDTGNKDYFVHRSEIEGMEKVLIEGQRVEFEVGENPKGPEARNVRILIESAG